MRELRSVDAAAVCPRRARRLRSVGVSGAVAVALLAGCQRIEEVSGRVTVDGKPGRGLVVMFDPAVKDQAKGVATTDGEGRYALRRLGPGAKTGVPTGTYRVRLMPDVDNPAASPIPQKYFRGSELSYEVVGGKPNVYDIEISTK